MFSYSKMSFARVFCLAVLAMPCWGRIGDSAVAETSAKVVFTQSVNLDDGTSMGMLKIHENEEPADAVYEFSKEHSMLLLPRNRQAMLNHICKSVPCLRREAVLFSISTLLPNNMTFEIMEGVEPIDAAHRFALQHKLNVEQRTQLFEEACKVVPCTRSKPVMWRKQVWVDNTYLREIVFMEDDEPADVLYKQLVPRFGHIADKYVRDQILEEGKQLGLPMTRPYALVYERSLAVYVGDEKTSITIKLFDNGMEPIDVLWELGSKYNFEKDFEWSLLQSKLLPEMCTFAPCLRSEPVIWKRILRNEEGEDLATVQVLRGEEPIDSIDAACQSLGATKDIFDALLEAACSELKCSRNIPIVLQAQIPLPMGETIKDDQDAVVGLLNVFENEDAGLAIRRFIQTYKDNVNESAYDDLKQYFEENLCNKEPRFKCDFTPGSSSDIPEVFEEMMDASEKTIEVFEELITASEEEIMLSAPADEAPALMSAKSDDILVEE